MEELKEKQKQMIKELKEEQQKQVMSVEERWRTKYEKMEAELK